MSEAKSQIEDLARFIALKHGSVKFLGQVNAHGQTEETAGCDSL